MHVCALQFTHLFCAVCRWWLFAVAVVSVEDPSSLHRQNMRAIGHCKGWSRHMHELVHVYSCDALDVPQFECPHKHELGGSLSRLLKTVCTNT